MDRSNVCALRKNNLGDSEGEGRFHPLGLVCVSAEPVAPAARLSGETSAAEVPAPAVLPVTVRRSEGQATACGVLEALAGGLAVRARCPAGTVLQTVELRGGLTHAADATASAAAAEGATGHCRSHASFEDAVMHCFAPATSSLRRGSSAEDAAWLRSALLPRPVLKDSRKHLPRNGTLAVGPHKKDHHNLIKGSDEGEQRS